MVENSGDLVCILNWSEVAAVPRWEACQVPGLLVSNYVKYIPETLDDEEMQDKGRRDFYEGKIENYKAWHLREFFEEMRRIAPEWVETLTKSSDKQGVFAAIEWVASDFFTPKIQQWLHCMLENRVPVQPLTHEICDPRLKPSADYEACVGFAKVENPVEGAD